MITDLEKALKLLKETIDSNDPRVAKYKAKAQRDYNGLKKDLDLIYSAYHRLALREAKLIEKYDLDFI